MLIYTGITAVCYLMDGLCFISTFRWFSVPGHEHAELLLLMATLLNFSIDIYYFIWVLSLKEKLPPKIGAFVSDAVLGYTQKMTRELYHNLDAGSRNGVEAAKTKLIAAKEQTIKEAKKAKEFAKNKSIVKKNKENAQGASAN